MRATKSSKDGLLAHWEAGIPLDSAWVDFAVFFDRFALTALHTHPDNDADVLGLEHPRYKELSKGWLPKTWETRQKKLAITTKNERIHLLGEIYAGHLWAIGFRTLASGSDELVRVPRQFFFFDETGEREQGPDIHWTKGQLKVGRTSYFDIRIAKVPPTGDTLAAPTNPVPKDHPDGAKAVVRQKTTKKAKVHAKHPDAKSRRKKVGGRPNTSSQVRREFRKLWGASSAFRSLNVKSMVPEVRAAIRGEERRLEETSGYRFSSMAKIIGQERIAARNENKRSKPNKPKAP
jgi:hypothetical protein